MSVAVIAPTLAPSQARKPSRRTPVCQVRQRTEFLIEALGSATALAALLGVSRSQPTQWRSGRETPSPAIGRLLLDLDHVMARATALWSAPVAANWLISANAYLDGARPVDVLRSRGSGEVIAAIDCALAGAYA